MPKNLISQVPRHAVAPTKMATPPCAAQLDAADSPQASAAKLNLMSAFLLHEFRSQLNVLTNASDLLEPYRPRLDTLGSRLLSAQQSSAKLLLNLLEHLTPTLALDKNAFSVDCSPFALRPWLTLWHSSASALPLATTGQKILFVDTCTVEPSVHADPLRLSQCLFNLLSNACKYGNSNESVILSLGIEDSHVRIAVTDHGAGLSEEDVARLFVPYERLGRHEMLAGQGLGLALTRMLIEAMGGRIEVKASSASGTRFSLLLPHLTEAS